MLKASAAQVLQSASEEDRVDIRSCGAQGGVFLFNPRDESHRMPDAHFLVAFRRRLCVMSPARLDAVEVLGPTLDAVGDSRVSVAPQAVGQNVDQDGGSGCTSCRHRYVEDNRLCSESLDVEGITAADIV